MIAFKTNEIITQDYYSLTLIVWCMKLKLKMFMKILVRMKKFLILEIFLPSEKLMMIQTNVVGKINDEGAVFTIVLMV